MRPVLYENGYSLHSLEQRLVSPLATRNLLAQNNLPVSPNPVADLILRRDHAHYVIIECKRASFGSETDQARQARGFIVAGGEIARRGLGITTGTAEICYVVGAQQQEKQLDTLNACR